MTSGWVEVGFLGGGYPGVGRPSPSNPPWSTATRRRSRTFKAGLVPTNLRIFIGLPWYPDTSKETRTPKR